MTDLATTRDDRSSHPTPPPSPPARRLGRRRWRDSRLLVGVLLVLVSVVVGARVFASTRTGATWVVARTDLPAGHVVTASDLSTTSADLSPDTSHRYYPGNRRSEIVGAMLSRPVSAGELISGDSFARGGGAATRVVTVIVKDGRAPALRAGDHIDVYVYRNGGAGSAVAGGVETLVLHNVEYLGEDVMSGGDRSLTLRVPVDVAISAVAASQTGRVDVSRIDGSGAATAAGSADGTAGGTAGGAAGGTAGGTAPDTGPTAIPGFGQ